MSEKTSEMILDVISPERTLVHAAVEAVELPGTKGRFEVLLDHAPLISSLEKGVIAYRNGEGTDKVAISSGFVEVNDNHVVACVEL
ncbi:MAG: F0F1 ATP synthase subunit epsilon [Alistipes sp.]|jgi:F-type H+-transporting ATPase subunit epsilon|uniref:F0F1 ATP synthase subunit epsilon n=1 Tax=Candidatus Cryptobacteroides bacterium TaxID=3085639 RepID=UPI00033ED0D9|nr:F0F1 ATP synthase subunit epsilon [Alistipes sp.]MEE0430684.1 F0F1 ATP synthase subunit epsilon [Bacteroidales bacterium]MEE1407764.1 F0F1 ATP synthase subunit epsilon [Bacteroidales bacterium]CDD16849.1 aTP synthase delta/epsilon subunit beta-sandwich domain protein [Alistipes sp. CAG:435]